jgi:hypothetical protein
MQIEFGPADPLIDGLIADLQPVALRRWAREAALLLLIGAVETLLFVVSKGLRPDIAQAIVATAFWWKAITAGAIAWLALKAALLSLDPAATMRPRLSRLWMALCAVLAAALVTGLFIEPSAREGLGMADRLQWREGLDCMMTVAFLSIVPMLALGLLMRRGASVQPARTALAAGLASAGFAAFVFALRCSHNDLLYVAVWYGGAMIAVAGLARLALPRLTRW